MGDRICSNDGYEVLLLTDLDVFLRQRQLLHLPVLVFIRGEDTRDPVSCQYCTFEIGLLVLVAAVDADDLPLSFRYPIEHVPVYLDVFELPVKLTVDIYDLELHLVIG